MGLVGELASLRLENALPYTTEQLQDRQRQYAWERGQVDYLGMDSFQHIQKHIGDVVSGKVEIQKEDAEKSEKAAKVTKKKGK
jgi:glycogenin glucosyltransferase